MAASTAHTDLCRAIWRKSTWSSPEGQNCVEIAANLRGMVAIRDSKHPSRAGPHPHSPPMTRLRPCREGRLA